MPYFSHCISYISPKPIYLSLCLFFFYFFNQFYTGALTHSMKMARYRTRSHVSTVLICVIMPLVIIQSFQLNLNGLKTKNWMNQTHISIYSFCRFCDSVNSSNHFAASSGDLKIVSLNCTMHIISIWIER